MSQKKNTPSEPSWVRGFAPLEPYHQVAGGFSSSGEQGLLVPFHIAAQANLARRILRRQRYADVADVDRFDELCKEALIVLTEDGRKDLQRLESILRPPTSDEVLAAERARENAASKPEPSPKPNAALETAPPQSRSGVAPVEVFTKANFVAWETAQRLHGSRDRDRVAMVKAILDRLADMGRWRPAVLPAHWRQSLATLSEEMPNFADVIATVHGACTLAEEARRPLRIPPMLLIAKPGVGKSRFAKCLAKALETTSYLYAMEAAETTSTLLGSDKHWGNAEAGVLFERIVMGETANPLVVLDEIDKAPQGRGAHYKPATALHGLLEPETASNLVDKALGFAFDGSYAIYLATANSLDTISESLLSRLTLHVVLDPTPRQSLVIARSVARSVIEELGLKDFAPVTAGPVLQELAMYNSARRQKQVIKQALIRALKAGRRRLLLEDLSMRRPGKTGRGSWLH